MTAEIQHISRDGVIRIKFSEKLASFNKYYLIDDSVLSITLLPGKLSDLNELDFNWKVIDMYTKTVEI